MAQKEAAVYIIDLGRSMGDKRHGRTKSNLDWAMDYVWDKITSTVLTGRKTALVGVVGFRTDETDVGNIVDEGDGYDHISILSNIKQFLLPDIRDLQRRLRPSKTNRGDVLSALVLAIQMISSATTGKQGKPLKYDRRIVIVTDGFGRIDIDDLDHIVSKIRQDEIELTFLGVDFDDPEYGFTEDDKDPEKEENEQILKEFVEKCDGSFGTLAEAVDQTDIPRVKDTRPTPSYRGTLTLGNSVNYEATLTIDVERYPCTMIARPPTASRFVVKEDMGAPEATQSSVTMGDDDLNAGGPLAAVRNQRVYQVDDPDEPGGKINVEPDDLERGYEYGRTAVHISESDRTVIDFVSQPGLEIIGFVDQQQFERYLAMSRTNFIIPQKTNEESKLALSSFIHALYESETYAVARLVTKENKAPLIVLLAPYIMLETEALIDVELPFAEDMRRYRFPPLNKKLTITGKVITEHRDLPNDKLMKAMSEYVDSMDLSTFGVDDEGNPAEYMTLDSMYSPLLHRINHVIRWRATNEHDTDLPEPPPILLKYSVPPADLVSRCKSKIAALKIAADVKRVPPKQKGRGKRIREHEKPLSGLDVDALLGGSKRVKIDSGNLIPSFKQALAATEDIDTIQAAANDMGKAIRSIISDSFGDSGYGRALEAMRVFRDEFKELEEPEMYNEFIRGLKEDVISGKLGGDRREMWWEVRKNQYGLIDQKTSGMSDVSEEEAEEFYLLPPIRK